MLATPHPHRCAMRAGRGISVAMLSVLSAATSPMTAPRRCIIYVDPCTGDVNDDRLNLVQESCESAGVQVVSVWSAGYARMLCARSDTAADEADKIRAALEPASGEERAWAERLQGKPKPKPNSGPNPSPNLNPSPSPSPVLALALALALALTLTRHARTRCAVRQRRRSRVR